MWSIWLRVSYIVQLLAACSLLFIPAQKKAHFKGRILFSTTLLLLYAYFVTPYFQFGQGLTIGTLIYWASYIFISAGFVWFCIDCRLREAFYLAVVCNGVQHIAFDFFVIYQLFTGGEYPLPHENGKVFFILSTVVIYYVFYQFFVEKFHEKGKYHIQKDVIIPMGTMILLVWLFNLIEVNYIAGNNVGTYPQLMYRLLDVICCIYVIWVQINMKEKMTLQKELIGIELASNQQYRQYAMTSDAIENINRKCHDLRHQIRALSVVTDWEEQKSYLEEIEKDIMIYDMAMQTGNRALDAVLMEKALFCKNHDIEWSCMVDGSKLSFLSTQDVYAIFGNALENAVEAVMKVEDKAKRVITVKIVEQNQLVMIQIQNYYNSQLDYKNGLPLSTKEESELHGYGMKSIRHTVQQYEGVITVKADHDIFKLQILFPV